MVSYVFYMEIHPNAFATELKRMIAAKIGQRYWIIKLKILFLRKVPPSCSTSSSIFFVPTTLDIRRQVAIAAIGIMTEFVRKSKKSRNCIPMIFTNPSGQGCTENQYKKQDSNQSSKSHACEYLRNRNKHQCRSRL